MTRRLLNVLDDRQAEDFTAKPVPFAKLCATAALVGIVRGLLEGGALEGMPLTTKLAQEALAKYEAAQ